MEIPNDTKEDRIKYFKQLFSIIKVCKKCSLHEGRTKTVPGMGSVMADIVIIGESPGKNEDLEGKPIVGRAGKLLDEILEECGTSRSEIFLLNIVKCKTPNNRDPDPLETLACNLFLRHQLSVIEPKIIITLGRYASHTVLNTKEAISRLRGKVKRIQGIPVMPTYHPSYLLRNSKVKEKVVEDITKCVKFLESRKKGLI